MNVLRADSRGSFVLEPPAGAAALPEVIGSPPSGPRGAAYGAAFLFAIGVHAIILFAIRGNAFQPPQYAVVEGDTSVEVSLVAAMPASAEEVVPEVPEELPSAIEEAPEMPAPAVPVPEPIPAIAEPPAVAEFVPKPEPTPAVSRKAPAPQPAAKAAKPAPARRALAVGDGSSAKPGLDATTLRAGAPGDRARPGYLRNPHPGYPESARRARQQGLVQLRVQVDASGRVSGVSLSRSSGHAELDARALSTVRDRWTFKPARVGGVAIASEVVVPVRFTLAN